MQVGRDVCFVCSNSNSFVCEHCHKVQLCRAHYAIHYNYDTRKCWPFRIDYKPGVGRCLVASRDIDAGELILTDASAASGLRGAANQSLCVVCFQASYYKCKCGMNVCRKCLSNHSSTLECKILEKSAYFDYDTKLQALTPLR